MALIKFYRGDAGVSLPSYQDGAIFIVGRDDTHGDIYVDIENGKRLHITPESPISYYTKSQMSVALGQSECGKVYVITDYETEGDKTLPGVKIGDGNAYIVDLPIFSVVTQEKKDFWDNKVDAWLASDIYDDGDPETLVLTRMNYHI